MVELFDKFDLFIGNCFYSTNPFIVAIGMFSAIVFVGLSFISVCIALIVIPVLICSFPVVGLAILLGILTWASIKIAIDNNNK